MTPALLTMMLTGPSAAVHSSTKALTSARLTTSVARQTTANAVKLFGLESHLEG